MGLIAIYKVLIYFSLMVKQENFAFVEHARISSWNQPVLSIEGKVSYWSWSKQLWWSPNSQLTDIHRIKSQTCHPMRHATPISLEQSFYSQTFELVKITIFQVYNLVEVRSPITSCMLCYCLRLSKHMASHLLFTLTGDKRGCILQICICQPTSCKLTITGSKEPKNLAKWSNLAKLWTVHYVFGFKSNQ